MCDGKRTFCERTSNYALEALTQFIHPNESCGITGGVAKYGALRKGRMTQYVCGDILNSRDLDVPHDTNELWASTLNRDCSI
jgi:hypothetical protein